MIKRILYSVFIVFCSVLLHAQDRSITSGMKISKTTRIKKAVYKLDAPVSMSKAVIWIEGNNVVVDFNNAELRGSNKSKNPDEFSGVAIMIRNSKKVTIRNLKAKHYKVAVMATNVEELVIDNCDLSYNYRQRLNSTQEKEDVSDWMSYHHNEKNEWLRYGAAIYLLDCNKSTVFNCKVTGGQNALMMTRCNNGMIYNNDFSFNSGIGIGMYRSSGNALMYNKLNFNVRGYSHNVYRRGQDSAGILVYEQSNNNLFYKNSATHSGDGFFLWAGQTTMDTGEGGCNDNRVIGNDFSFAPTNGVEVTFSRNEIIDNRMFECDYGIWGGYSYESNFTENKFKDNRIDIAIEHGHHNKITYNVFYESKEAVRLWAKEKQNADFVYAGIRDTKSHDYAIAFNNFSRCSTAVSLARTSGINFFSNLVGEVGELFNMDSTVTGLDTTISRELTNQLAVDTVVAPMPQVPNPMDPFKGGGRLAGRKNIRMTSWGPYDFRSPIIWNANPTDTSDELKFDILGPAGKWKVKTYRGLTDLSSLNGEMPSSITAKKMAGSRTDIFIELEYNGAAITTPFGDNIVAGKPSTFSFKKFFQPLDWEVLFYPLDTASHNPITKGTMFSLYEKRPPFRTENVTKLDYAWWGGIKEGERQYSQFRTIASATAEIPKGLYELAVTWDDAVRVYIDDKLVIDEWKPSKYKFDESPNRKVQLNLGGNHHFRVEHVELGGFAALVVKLTLVK